MGNPISLHFIPITTPFPPICLTLRSTFPPLFAANFSLLRANSLLTRSLPYFSRPTSHGVYIYISRPWANPLANAKTTLYPPPPSPTHGSYKYTTALCYTRVDFPLVRAAGLESRLFSSEGEGGSEVLFPLTTVVRKCIREIRRDTRKTNRVNRVKGATESIRRGNLENKELKWM